MEGKPDLSYPSNKMPSIDLQNIQIFQEIQNSLVAPPEVTKGASVTENKL